jgi:uncharacterized membrane protein
MEHVHQVHAPAHAQAPHGTPGESLNRIASVATLHCLLGCAIGEVLGLVLGNALGWSSGQTIVLAAVLAFMSGFALTADAASITILEVVDNAILRVIPGAMDAAVLSLRFWTSMALALVVAGVAAFPVNRWLIARGRGHAAVHVHH